MAEPLEPDFALAQRTSMSSSQGSYTHTTMMHTVDRMTQLLWPRPGMGEGRGEDGPIDGWCWCEQASLFKQRLTGTSLDESGERVQLVAPLLLLCFVRYLLGCWGVVLCIVWRMD
jgi:hypothetical protein